MVKSSDSFTNLPHDPSAAAAKHAYLPIRRYNSVMALENRRRMIDA